MGEESERVRAAFLAALSPEGGPQADALLCRDLDVYAHPRAARPRAGSNRWTPSSTSSRVAVSTSALTGCGSSATG